jgi:hypothetical protein
MNPSMLQDATSREEPMFASRLRDAIARVASMNRLTLAMMIGGGTVLIVWLGLWITSTGMLVYSASISPLGTRDCRYLVGVSVHKRYERRTQHCPFFRSAEAASTAHRENASSPSPTPRSSAAPAPRASAAPAPRSSASRAPTRSAKASRTRTAKTSTTRTAKTSTTRTAKTSTARTRRVSTEVPPP